MSSSAAPSQPPAINYVAGFLLVGLAWGLTTPFIRRAAKTHSPPAHPLLARDDVKASWLKSRVYGAFFAVADLLRNPRYAVPLLINLTGSVWFFLLIGQAGELPARLYLSVKSCRLTSPCRTQLDCSDCKHASLLVHCARRLVGGQEGNRSQ